jgi:scyllo-inositol 2-dehydrogenase (NADP+)
VKHKIGIIGYGGIAGWHHENSKRVDKIECVAAYDIDPERLKVAKAKGLEVFSTLESFFDKGEFDIVLVATPNNFHKDMAIAAMEKGKHVVCEKPVAMSSVELQEMLKAAERNKVLFTVHQNRRWDKDFKIVSKVVEDGLIGKPYTIESRVHGSGGVIHGWRAYKVSGGGMLLDWGVHLIDQIMYLIPEKVVNVFARMYCIKTPEVDDYFKAILTFESGLNAQIEVGTYCLKTLPRWYVNGDLGSVYINGWDCDGGVIHAKELATEWVPEIVQTSAGPTRTMAPRPKETIDELQLPEVNTDWADFYRNVIEVLDEDRELIVKPAEVMRVLKVIEACFSSAETGKTIEVNV